MDKNLLSQLFFLLLTTSLLAQVGIGTAHPSAATLLHVDDNAGDKGILIPRVQIDNLNNALPITTVPETGTMVFNNAGANPHGFYYWDSSKWVRLTGSDTDETLYTKNGTLTGNRVITTDDNSLTVFNNLSAAKDFGRDALSLKRGNNSKEVGLSFQNSGGFYDAAISLQPNTGKGLLFSTGGNQANPEDILASMTIEDDGQITLPRYTASSFNGAPISYLGLDAAGNVIKSDAETSTKNFYNSNGTLTSERTIQTDDHTILYSNSDNRSLRLKPADPTSNNAPFIWETNNAISFQVDAVEVLTLESGYDVGINQPNPQQQLHIGGASETIRIDGLNTTNNTNNIAADPVPVYVNNDGDLVTQPSLVQSFIAINKRNFVNGGSTAGTSVTSDENTGASKDVTLDTSTIILTQPSLVHYTYQLSVSVTRRSGAAIVDGAPRLFRSWFTVTGDPIHYGYDTGTYTNKHENTSGTMVSYAAGFYYLNGSGYVQLPAGTHTLNLFGRGYGSDFDYKINFGESPHESITAIIHR